MNNFNDEKTVINNLKEEYNSGNSLRKLSLKYNVSPSHIRNLLMKERVLLRKQGGRPVSGIKLLISQLHNEELFSITTEDIQKDKQIVYKILVNSNFKCRRCEFLYKGTYDLMAHHINPFLKYDNPKEYLITEERVLLCDRCHVITHNEINKFALESIRNTNLNNIEKKKSIINFSKELLDIPLAIPSIDNKHPIFKTSIGNGYRISLPLPIINSLNIQRGDDVSIFCDEEEKMVYVKFPAKPVIFDRKTGILTTPDYKKITESKSTIKTGIPPKIPIVEFEE